jgi:hypothetical protein
MNLNHRNRDLDQKIDAALKMLSEAQPPAEMESRIQRELNAAGSVPGKNRRGRLLWIPTGCVAAAAAVLLVFFALSSGPGTKQAPTTENAKLETVPPTPSLPASYEPKIVAPENNSEQAVPKVRRNSHRSGRHEYRHAASLLSYPLTKQEKLLVEFAQNAKPKDLQYLNPEYQKKLEEQQKAEFAAYLKSVSISSTQGAAN